MAIKILEALRTRRKERTESAGERFKALAADIRSGKPVSEETAEQVLTLAGKTETDLAEEISRLDTVAALRSKLVDVEETRNQIRKRSAASEKSKTEQESYVKEAQGLRLKLEQEIKILSQKLQDNSQAERELSRMGESLTSE